MLIEDVDRPEIRGIAVHFGNVKVEPHKGALYSLHGFYDSRGDLNPGIRVYPDLIIPKSFVGFIYITQLVDNKSFHEFQDGTFKCFNTNGKVADGHYHNHYSIYKIENDKSQNIDTTKVDEILLSDAPHQELCSNLMKLKYDASFETYIQYSDGYQMLENLQNLCRFNWRLRFDVARIDGNWVIEKQENSTESEITASFCSYSREAGIDPRGLDEIRDLYNAFR